MSYKTKPYTVEFMNNDRETLHNLVSNMQLHTTLTSQTFNVCFIRNKHIKPDVDISLFIDIPSVLINLINEYICEDCTITVTITRQLMLLAFNIQYNDYNFDVYKVRSEHVYFYKHNSIFTCNDEDLFDDIVTVYMKRYNEHNYVNDSILCPHTKLSNTKFMFYTSAKNCTVTIHNVILFEKIVSIAKLFIDFLKPIRV